MAAVLKRLRVRVPDLCDLLKISTTEGLDTWGRLIDGKLMPRLSPDFPLIAAICGGGSSGKSTLFNALAGDRISPVGGSAGINRRVLAAIHPRWVGKNDFLPNLFSPFAAAPKAMTDGTDLTVGGDPLYVACENIPQNLVIMDTPDFDTGSRGIYTNRQAAREALEAADILIYIFTNANYSNRDNTDFMARMLSGIGRRKCYLVYRVYPSFTPAEVREHAWTVAHNLYGNDANHYLLGIYRSDEDNRVAAGETFIQTKPVADTDPTFSQALKQLNPQELRLELFAANLAGVVRTASEALETARVSQQLLGLYLDALKTAQSHCVHGALQHFPTDTVIQSFADIWRATDPAPIRFMRSTGRLLDLPLKALVSSAGWIRRRFAEDRKKAPAQDVGDPAEVDLSNAANRLHRLALSPEIKVSLAAADPVALRMRGVVEQISGPDFPLQPMQPPICADTDTGSISFTVPCHPAVASAQEDLRRRPWASLLSEIMSRKGLLTDLSATIRQDLSVLAAEFRSRMGFWSHVRQTFSALLNVIPATAAVTYILSTGDPVGAVGIKVKLAGLFGLHDLYALVAIPATTGLKQADEGQLKEVLGPLAQTWLNEKLETLNQLFEDQITAEIIDAGNRAFSAAQNRITELEGDIDQCKRLLISTRQSGRSSTQ